MHIRIDTEKNVLEVLGEQGPAAVELYSREGLELLSEVWLKVQWNQRHWQSFSWMGLPVWQLPEDLLRLQEAVWDLGPDVIVETGVNQGGSAVFFASLCKIQGKGRVISIDITIPDKVRQDIEGHPLSEYITLIEADSVSDGALTEVARRIGAQDRVLVFLDSDHSKRHVAEELQAYSRFVSPGSFIVACDGVMETLHDTPHGREAWLEDNPAAAAREFVAQDPDFEITAPPVRYGKEYAVDRLTYWPDAWIRRLR